MFLKSCRLGIEYYCCCYSFTDIAGLCVRFNQVRSASIPKVLVIMIFFYPVNALILKWYAEDFVVYTSKVSLPSCKLYFPSKFVRIITVFFAAGDFGQRPKICWPMANTEASSCPRAKKKNSGTHGILTSPEIKKVLTLMFCRQVRQSVVGY